MPIDPAAAAIAAEFRPRPCDECGTPKELVMARFRDAADAPRPVVDAVHRCPTCPPRPWPPVD